MDISQHLIRLFENRDGAQIPAGVLGYFNARVRNKLHELVVNEFIRSGLSMAQLSSRLNKSPAQITRWLGTSGNWTIDTASNLLLAISGATIKFEIERPHKEPMRNLRGADWVKTVPGTDHHQFQINGLPSTKVESRAPTSKLQIKSVN